MKALNTKFYVQHFSVIIMNTEFNGYSLFIPNENVKKA